MGGKNLSVACPFPVKNVTVAISRFYQLSITIALRISAKKDIFRIEEMEKLLSWGSCQTAACSRNRRQPQARLKALIDATIPKAKDFDDFLRLMEAAGYEIKRGKFVSFRAPGQERFTRSKTLGEAYTVEAITERIAGTYRAKPKALRQEKTGVSMLIDIQNSIKAAESKGYEQWAKIHNLKQAAKTLNFLTEHDISEYEQLQAVLDEVHTESENTAAMLKGLEKRLSDISLLMKNISVYQQTKAVYMQYKKAKDKEKFLRGNESSSNNFPMTPPF